LFWGIGVVAVLYCGLQTVSVAAMPGLAGTHRPLVEVSATLFGPTGAAMMMIGMVASVGGNLSGTLITAPRITYALALDGSLPDWFASVPERFGTPAFSIVTFAVFAFVLAAGGSFVWLAGLSVLTRLLIYIGCAAALTTLRRRAADEPKVMRLPGGWLIPGAAALICFGLLTQVRPRDWLVTAAMLCAGSLLYALARLTRATGLPAAPEAAADSTQV
jgi:amino acid transporter